MLCPDVARVRSCRRGPVSTGSDWEQRRTQPFPLLDSPRTGPQSRGEEAYRRPGIEQAGPFVTGRNLPCISDCRRDPRAGLSPNRPDPGRGRKQSTGLGRSEGSVPEDLVDAAIVKTGAASNPSRLNPSRRPGGIGRAAFPLQWEDRSVSTGSHVSRGVKLWSACCSSSPGEVGPAIVRPNPSTSCPRREHGFQKACRIPRRT
jgi:hypothetical protein